MKALRLLAAVAAAHSLGACASILSGTSQEITVDSNPRGADCELVRQEEVLARVHTPETITVKKTKHDINVSCSKEGYQVSREHLKSKIQDATWGNIVAGGGIGWAIDSASGADNKYDDHVTVTLMRSSRAHRPSQSSQMKQRFRRRMAKKPSLRITAVNNMALAGRAHIRALLQAPERRDVDLADR